MVPDRDPRGRREGSPTARVRSLEMIKAEGPTPRPLRLEDRQWAGALGVGVFTEQAPDGLHSIVSFITFLFAALSAILACRVLRPPLSYLSVLLGVRSLLPLGLYIPKNDFDLGNGGMEHMIVYPVLAWGIGFGGYLLGMAHGNERPAAA